METFEYIKNWIYSTSKLFSDKIFKYKRIDDDFHVIKYSDELNENNKFMELASDLILDFIDEFDKDVILIPLSDTYLGIDNFDLEYTPNNYFTFEMMPINTYRLIYSKNTTESYNDSGNYSLAA